MLTVGEHDFDRSGAGVLDLGASVFGLLCEVVFDVADVDGGWAEYAVG